MNVITIDFETYYDQDYSLKNMTTAEYVWDKKFQVLCVGVKLNDDPTVVIEGEGGFDEAYLNTLPWDESICVAHNALFDGAILEWRYDIQPLRYFCTWQGANPVVGQFVKSTSLANLSEFFGVGIKGNELLNTKGKRFDDFAPNDFKALKDYCANDVELTFRIYRILNAWYKRNNHAFLG
jgi:ribonuclease D